MKKPTFVIEHLEKRVWRWCEIEYENASKLIKPYPLLITNLKRGKKEFSKFAKLEKKSITDLDINWERVCVLDPKATEVLKPEDKEKFDYFVFGGILGDEEFNGRTGKELTERMSKKVVLKHLGEKQFSTDNALFVTKLILDGKKLEEIKTQWQAEVDINEVESIILPYCYPLVDGKPQMSSALVEYLKRKKGI
ncbi:MAG TPA: SAM-dependent methyltransferase [Candidatus Nanoarchaeia archaeon]|nr:SAM-dependent methyltransferase [Candidatus Nanoarchaeia archaeon]